MGCTAIKLVMAQGQLLYPIEWSHSDQGQLLYRTNISKHCIFVYHLYKFMWDEIN